MTSAIKQISARLFIGVVAGALFPLMGGMPIAARAQVVARDPGAMVKNISMGVGRSLIIDLPRDASEIFIGSPDVANAVVRSSRRLFIMAVKAGQTSIYALDAEGRQIAVINITTGRNVEELAQILRAALPRSDVTARTVNDTIILTGTVDSPGDAQQALDIANGFVGALAGATAAGGQAANAGKVVNAVVIRGRDQVMVKVTIAEVQRNIVKTLGVTSGQATGAWGAFTMANQPSINGGQGIGANVLTLGNGTLGGTLQAFERSGVGRILAEPNVTAVSGESAKFTAGGEVPIAGGTTCSANTAGQNICTTNILYKPYGVTLNFTPVVQSEGRILLRIATEVTEIDNQNQITANGASAPGFRTRKHETTVELPSGGSVASAGLISVRSAQAINGLPGLMNLPILGALFRSRDYLRNETELMIIVTPYITKPVAAKDLARPTDNFNDATDPQSVLLGRVNRLYSTTSNPQVIQNFKGKVGFIND